jgi:exopolysaccharide biosynthesis polyprenyl glycosylphosphotransferase
MAVANQHITTLRPLRLPAAVAGTEAHVAPRWLMPLFLVTLDGVAVVGATLVIGVANLLPLLYAVLAIASLAAAGAYRSRMTLRALDSAPWLVGRLAWPLQLVAPAAWLGGDITGVLQVALVSVPLVVGARVVAYGVLRHTRRRGELLDPALILGAGEVGVELAVAFRDYPELGVAPVGFVDCVHDQNLPLPVLGDVDRLDALLDESDIRRVIVAFGPAREAELVRVLRTAVQHNVDVHVVPRFFDCGVAPEGPDTDDVHGIPLYRVQRAALRAPAWVLKRCLDVVVGGIAVVLTAPLAGVIAVLVKITSPGPVLFHQTRVGQYCEKINVTKFRTLRINHDSDTRWSVDDDPRVTPVGRFLRAVSLDELPQLWSVVKGDMSLVGPRPERPFFVERFSTSVEGYDDRHRLPVGLTGWAQVHGLRGDTSIDARARYDNQYIQHWTLWRDLVILARTLAEVLRGAVRTK